MKDALKKLAEAWADFDGGDEKRIRAAMQVLETLGRLDLSNVMRVTWVARTKANTERRGAG